MSGRQRAKAANRTAALRISVCIIGIVVVALAVRKARKQWVLRLDEKRAKDHVRVWNFHQLYRLAISTKLATAISGHKPPADLTSLFGFIREYVPVGLDLDGDGHDDAEGDVLLDSWGNPIQLVVASPRRYTFTSFGPNGIDDGGRRDDITYTFDPMDLEVDGGEGENQDANESGFSQELDRLKAP